jgi:hypothetical protein
VEVTVAQIRADHELADREQQCGNQGTNEDIAPGDTHAGKYFVDRPEEHDDEREGKGDVEPADDDADDLFATPTARAPSGPRSGSLRHRGYHRR